MRPNHQPVPHQQPNPDSPSSEARLPQVGGTAQVGRQDITASPWKTPWSEAGLPEPGWWKAFAVDKNVRSTRTPRRITADRDAVVAKASAIVEAVTRTLEPKEASEPTVENPVANRIADLRSAFRAGRARERRRQARAEVLDFEDPARCKPQRGPETAADR